MVFSLKYQQTQVRSFARFSATDPDSGRREYFPSRSNELDVTNLVGNFLRLGDSNVATLHGTTLKGASPGKTQIKVICNCKSLESLR